MTLTSRLIPADFSYVPSQAPERTVGFLVPSKLAVDLDAVGFGIGTGGEGARAVGIDFASLTKAGFEGKVGQTLVLPQSEGAVYIAVGVGDPDDQTPAALRDVAAAFARAAARFARVGFDLGESFRLEPAIVGQLIAEGMLLARYRYTELQTKSTDVPLVSVDILTPAGNADAVSEGVRIGEATARATNIARDLSNAPPGHLTAIGMATAAAALGEQYGLEVESFDKQQLIELGCGGLLGVNAGSAEEPRMVKLTYSPASPSSHVALVGKGIMYDAGGISLKPSDSMHLLMKMDMAGAAAVLGAMTALGALGCTTAVTGYLMCTDNMPSGTAMGLGDVLTIRGGTTIEIKNTDAEGRLVMADALVLAAEQRPDAIIDIATLTGSALQTLGPRVAALFGNNSALVAQAFAASAVTDELIWQLPLEHRYREQLNSSYADMSNMGGPFNVAITAALFLNEFVDGIPWAHFDIAGTMQSEKDDSWRSSGATGFGTRLLIEMLTRFSPVS
jgi:leucyl aminopeptidase